MAIRDDLVVLLSKATLLEPTEVALMISVPPDTKMGDFAFPCFKLGKNPKLAAEDLKGKLVLPDSFLRTEVMGPYLNFFVNSSFLAQHTISQILTKGAFYGRGNARKKMLIEYCGPNTNKPLHLGHLRNMSLGNAMVHLLAFQGNDVHPVNIINDRGVHICQSMYAYSQWGNNLEPTKKGDHYVGDFYVLFAKAMKENPDLKDEAQKLLVQWEEGNADVRALWKKMNAWVLSGFASTYKRFGVSFEKEYFESEYYMHGRDIALKGLADGVFEKDEKGGIVAPLEKFNIPSKVILRSDGTSIYITQDMYLALKRYEDYHFETLCYVVASEQNLHFQQLFAIMKLLKKPFADKLHHLTYGLVNLPTGRMKSREGTVVDADDLMDEVSNLAFIEVEKHSPDLSVEEKRRRAEFIAIGAIRFFLIRTDPVKEIIFNPEDSMNFEGETGPYLQYTHARASSIIRKARAHIASTSGWETSRVKYNTLSSESEKRIVSLLARFGEAVDDSATHYRPHVLCRYLLDLAQAFNGFYHSEQVISDDQETMNTRVELVLAVTQVLSNGLGCLGIHAPDEM